MSPQLLERRRRSRRPVTRLLVPARARCDSGEVELGERSFPGNAEGLEPGGRAFETALGVDEFAARERRPALEPVGEGHQGGVVRPLRMSAHLGDEVGRSAPLFGRGEPFRLRLHRIARVDRPVVRAAEVLRLGDVASDDQEPKEARVQAARAPGHHPKDRGSEAVALDALAPPLVDHTGDPERVRGEVRRVVFAVLQHPPEGGELLERLVPSAEAIQRRDAPGADVELRARLSAGDRRQALVGDLECSPVPPDLEMAPRARRVEVAHLEDVGHLVHDLGLSSPRCGSNRPYRPDETHGPVAWSKAAEARLGRPIRRAISAACRPAVSSSSSSASE